MAKDIPEKLFYKIGDVCELTDTQPYVLRFWESEFPMLSPQKNRSGQRIYRKHDIELVERIKTLLYDEGYTIAGARKRLEQEEAGEAPEKAAAVPQPPPDAEEPAGGDDRRQRRAELLQELRDILAVMDETDGKLRG